MIESKFFAIKYHGIMLLFMLSVFYQQGFSQAIPEKKAMVINELKEQRMKYTDKSIAEDTSGLLKVASMLNSDTIEKRILNNVPYIRNLLLEHDIFDYNFKTIRIDPGPLTRENINRFFSTNDTVESILKNPDYNRYAFSLKKEEEGYSGMFIFTKNFIEVEKISFLSAEMFGGGFSHQKIIYPKPVNKKFYYIHVNNLNKLKSDTLDIQQLKAFPENKKSIDIQPGKPIVVTDSTGNIHTIFKY